ncbi:MAG: ferredoxin, partial [Gammaproteobacteria bacterium]|nr:ferredoxin [Gammaproteobacteria bacterium]
WFVTGKERLYLDNLCRSWRDALENFRYTARVLGAGTDATEAADRVLAEVLEDAEGLAGHDVYVAGPAPLVEAATARLLAHGLPPSQIRTEVTGLAG